MLSLSYFGFFLFISFFNCVFFGHRTLSLLTNDDSILRFLMQNDKPGIRPGRNGKGGPLSHFFRGGHCGPETKPGSGNLTWKQTGKKLWQGFVPGITLVVLCGEKNSWSGAMRNDQNDHQESLCVPGEFQVDSGVVRFAAKLIEQPHAETLKDNIIEAF